MREDLQDYLNLFSIMVNPPKNKYEKVKKILELGLEKPVLIRFREKNLVNSQNRGFSSPGCNLGFIL